MSWMEADDLTIKTGRESRDSNSLVETACGCNASGREQADLRAFHSRLCQGPGRRGKKELSQNNLQIVAEQNCTSNKEK